jgi:protein ImuB
MAFASIFVPNFMLQAVVRSEPSLRDRALVLVEATSLLRPVIGLNEAASKAGVKLGMTKSQAQQFGEIEVRHPSPAQEEIAHAALLDLGWSVSPRIEDTAADTVVLDLAGLAGLFGSQENIAGRLAERALRLGFITQIATASNLDAAILASRAFAGITVIPGGEEAALIGKAPVIALGWHRHSCLCAEISGQNSTGKSACATGSLPRQEVLETLERWGVHTCAALAALPVLQLSERLGQEGVRLHELARGRSTRAMVLAQPAIYFEEEMELEYAVAQIEPLAFLVGQLLDLLCARLVARSLAAGAIRVRLQLEPCFDREHNAHCHSERSEESRLGSGAQEATSRARFLAALGMTVGSAPDIYERTLRLPLPMSDSKMLLKLLTLHLQSDAPSAPILKIRLAAEAARPRVLQAGLFSPLCPDPEKTELTVARLAKLVGDSNLGSPELLDTHRPEGFRMCRFVPNRDAADLCRPIRRSPRGQDAAVCRRAERRSAFGRAPLAPTFENSPVGDPSLTPIPSPARAGEGCRKQGEGSVTQGLRPGLNSSAPGGAGEPRKTAFRVFRPALPARVEVRQGCPAWVAFPGHYGRVVAASGPWRGSGDWWREDGWESDEWDIEVQYSRLRGNDQARSGVKGESAERGVYRVFYDLARKEWFVRGAYD